MGLFLLALPVSSALGAPLSSAIIQYWDGLFGLSGWRVMFLLEGIPAVVLAVVTWFYLTDRPSQATWLDEDEKVWLTRELESEAAESGSHISGSVRRALTDSRVWMLGLVYFGITYGLYSLSFFLPSIVAGFKKTFDTDFSLVTTGLIVAVPFAVGAVAMVLWSRHSDRTGERIWHVAIPTLIGAVSIPIALYMQSPLTTMIAVTVNAVGVFCALPVFWYLPSTFLTGAGAAAGIAVVNSVGNTSGFGGPVRHGMAVRRHRELTRRPVGRRGGHARRRGAGSRTQIAGNSHSQCRRRRRGGRRRTSLIGEQALPGGRRQRLRHCSSAIRSSSGRVR